MRRHAWFAIGVIATGCRSIFGIDDPMLAPPLIDAPAPCSTDDQCTDPNLGVCDPAIGRCVACTPNDHASCTAPTTKCGLDDRCYECLIDGDCGSGLCLVGGVCAMPADILYATPDGTGDCSSGSKCTLTTAVGMLGAKHIIQLDPGSYPEGPITIVIPVGSHAQIQGPTTLAAKIKANGTGPVLDVRGGGALELDYLDISGATGNHGVLCEQSSQLTVYRSKIRDNVADGIHSQSCTLRIERCELYNNYNFAIKVDSPSTVIRNNFIYSNGNANLGTGAAVYLTNQAAGELRFNTIAFNLSRTTSASGLRCAQNQPFDASDNLFAGNTNNQIVDNSHLCNVTGTYVGTPTSVHFVSASLPYDLHLTAVTPTTIRDVSSSICTGMTDDFDGDVRPYNMFCDLGADEFK